MNVTEKLLLNFPDGSLNQTTTLQVHVPWRRVERPAIGLRTPFTLTKPAYLFSSNESKPLHVSAIIFIYTYVVKISYTYNNK